MLLSHISYPSTYQLLTENSIWQLAIEWIKQQAHKSRCDIFELRGRDMFVNVHGYDTMQDHLCKFESHRRYVDLQYCISGGEKVEWMPTEDLEADGSYDEENDVQFYNTEKKGNMISFTPGMFGIFYPEDGHRPKISDEINTNIKKLVVKISLKLLI